jgi:hypothetical protein
MLPTVLGETISVTKCNRNHFGSSYFVQKARKVYVLHKMITVKDVDYLNDFREEITHLPRASRGDELRNCHVLCTVKLNLILILNLRRQSKIHCNFKIVLATDTFLRLRKSICKNLLHLPAGQHIKQTLSEIWCEDMD